VIDIKLNSPLQYIKGVGPKRAEILRELGFKEVQDILFYFPRHYLDRTNIIPVSQLIPNQSVTIIGTVKAHGILFGRKRRYEVILEDDSGAVTLVWFHGLKFWERLFKKGQIFAATGIVTYYMGMQMVHPDLERLEDESDKMIHAGRIIPVYPQTAELNKVGLNSKSIRKLTTFLFEHLKEPIPDYLPDIECRINNLPSLNQAVLKIHYPEARDDIEYSRRRLAFDELLKFQNLIFQSRNKKELTIKSHLFKKPSKKIQSFVESLPFELTSGQTKATTEIFLDLQKKHPMSRLLQGDVGCGKTVVAIIAGLYVAGNCMQAAFMAPTEILAEQHFRNWEKILKKADVKTGLLTSSMKSADKKKTAELCGNGEIDILFGTHALIYDYVQFKKLGLVIIDEQHRFGVEQRGKLYAKGDNPDLLVMTATPIPRTLALTLYGDLDISTIETLPLGRQPIRTVWRTKDVRDKVYQFIIDDAKKGGQTYIVYPLIDKSEQMELENVEDAYNNLTTGVLKNLRVGMIHGKVKADKRDAILGKFFNKELDVLMATTVIEVGLDNPHATIMVIEHAERFGLAQLHQLRGRIGRGSRKATLVAIAHPPLSEIGQKRLEYFTSTTDGFKIAEADLELRGSGEMFGYRQSGLPDFKTAHIARDRDLIDASRKLLENLFQKKNSLDSSYQKLYNYLSKMAEKTSEYMGGG